MYIRKSCDDYSKSCDEYSKIVWCMPNICILANMMQMCSLKVRTIFLVGNNYMIDPFFVFPLVKTGLAQIENISLSWNLFHFVINIHLNKCVLRVFLGEGAGEGIPWVTGIFKRCLLLLRYYVDLKWIDP